VCCESSARDAAELEYKVILVSDALSGHAHGLHEATLATFCRIFGDVRPSNEVIDMLRSRVAGETAPDGREGMTDRNGSGLLRPPLSNDPAAATPPSGRSSSPGALAD
jgi:hypothetical protein